MRKVIICLAGATLLFVWNAFSWMALPFHSNTLRTVPEGAIDFHLLHTQMKENGVYHFPGLDTENISNALESGRIPFMVYIKGKTEVFDPFVFLKSFFLNAVLATLIFLVVQQFPAVSRAKIVVNSLLLGLIVGFASDFPQMNWYMFPFSYTLVNALDHLIGFGLLGVLYGRFINKAETNVGR